MNRRLLLFSALYAVALICMSALRPFWLDEILQLIGTRAYSGAALIHYVTEFPGSAPLGYFVQHWSIALLGFSALSARLSSAIFAVLSGIVLVSCVPTRSRWPLLVFWAVLPLQLRYALEARPYSQGLFFAVLGTAAFLNLISRPALGRAVVYAAVVALGIYSVPYTLFLQAGYVTWLMVSRKLARETIWAASAVTLAVASYLPWYVTAAQHWRKILVAVHENSLNVSLKFFLLPIREISGGGYVCSLALISLAMLGCLSPALNRSLKMFLLSGIVLGLFGPILTDAVFGYFFAIRQAMFILAPLTILAAHAFDQPRRQAATGLLAATLIAGAVVKDVRYFSDGSENWASGAAAIHSAVGQGACVKFVDDQDANIYGFFDASLAPHDCAGAGSIAIPYHRYTGPAILQPVIADLRSGGYSESHSAAAGGTEILIFTRSRAGSSNLR